jgi:membrane-associated phospholipid phosphatase
MRLRIWILGLLICVLLGSLSIAYVDRPVADFLERNYRHTEVWFVLDRALKPLSLVAVLALLFLFFAAGRALFGFGLTTRFYKPLVCSCAIVWGLATEFVFKQIFGRSWPEPTYIRDHLYGFRFLHASQGWTSFPSGTAIGSTALATVISTFFPRWRFAAAVLATAVCAAMILENYHWVSDVIAGGFLGTSIGYMTLASLRPFFRGASLK